MAPSPAIKEMGFSQEELKAFIASERHASHEAELLLDYPTVYVVHNHDSSAYDVYVGETSDIASRTLQHLNADPISRDDWRSLAEAEQSRMFVIGHPYFNKSLTLDIENRLMLYLSGVESVRKLNNRRSNAQRCYYTQEHFDSVFQDIWSMLSRRNKKLFPAEEIIRESALFKASPFHKLTSQQLDTKREIQEAILAALQDPRLGNDQMGKLIVVRGAAGTGKTVLLSSLFYDLFQGEPNDDEPFEFRDRNAYLLVNHHEQLTVYEQIATKLGLQRRGKRVFKPASFIKRKQEEKNIEIVLVDEAHLLWTQGTQGYSGKNQLMDLLRMSKVVVAVYDPDQAIATSQYWEPSLQEWLAEQETLTLTQQMRIDAAPETWTWIRDFVDSGVLNPIPDDPSYDVKVFDSPAKMQAAVLEHNSSVERGLSRLVATYDWPYSNIHRPEGGGHWCVGIGDFTAPWNRELKQKKRRGTVDLAWAERPETVGEVGSHFTVQGFDLNYVAVILGPSIIYRNGRVVIDPTKSEDAKATQRRGISGGGKVDIAEQLVRNQLNILMTRGVHGLYLYAVDDELQKALVEANTARLQ